MRFTRSIAALSALGVVALLAACGGGSGSSGGGNIGNPLPPTPTTSPTSTPSTTNASGTLVNYQTGKGMGGVPVAIGVWNTPPPWPPPAGWTPPPMTVVATTAPDGSFAFTAKNGHYLLQIGSNATYTPPPTWTPPPTTGTAPPPPGEPGITSVSWQATVHDNITLTGGNQVLVAPSMPPQPLVTNPAVQNGPDYRIATLTGVEAECLATMDVIDTQIGHPLLVPDEWLVENTRDINASQAATNTFGSGAIAVSKYNAFDGNINCYSSLMGNYQSAPASALATLYTNPLVQWFGGAFTIVGNQQHSQGVAMYEWALDPRAESAADPLYNPWP
ncbi:MAG: hypothetical protein ACYDA5_05090 [Vulcanimicrobiaceae bacterium]